MRFSVWMPSEHHHTHIDNHTVLEIGRFNVAVFASVLAILHVDHLFLALILSARFVNHVCVANQADGAFDLEVIGLVTIAQILLFGFMECHPFGWNIATASLSRNACANLTTATIIEPSTQEMTFGAIGILFKHSATNNRHRFSTAEFADSGSFDKQNWLAKILEIFGFCSPQRQIHRCFTVNERFFFQITMIFRTFFSAR